MREGERQLPRRDLVLLPVLAILTVLLVAGISELAARLSFRKSDSSMLACLVVDDPATGVRGVPDSLCRQKIFESPLVEYRFNACGFRTPQPCTAAPPGTYRIVLIGSSMPQGMHVAQRDSFAAKLGPALSRRLDRPVDIFNEAMPWGTPTSLALRTDAMLAPHPDMILWVLTPFDIENAGLLLPWVQGRQEQRDVPPPHRRAAAAAAAARNHSLFDLPRRAFDRLGQLLSDSRTAFVFRHYLFRNQGEYLDHALAQGHEIDYLRAPPPPELRDNIDIFAGAIDRIAARARAAGVPLVVTLLPSRAQTIMLSNPGMGRGYDPRQLARLVRPIVAAKGAQYVDMTRGLEAMPKAGELFLAVDEHQPPAGHAMWSRLIADALVRSGYIRPGGSRSEVVR